MPLQPNDEYDPMFDAAGQYYNVDPQLIKTVFHVESGGNPNVGRGTSGEIGGMQIMPATAARIGVVDPSDMTQAIPAAARLLREGLDKTGTPGGALRYYNGGGGGPSNPATIPYVLKAQTLYGQLQMRKAGKGAGNAPAPSNDPAQLGDQIISGGGNAPPAAKSSGAGGGGGGGGAAANDPAVAAGDQLISQSLPSPAQAAQQQQQKQAAYQSSITNPQTGQQDTIMPGVRNLLSEDPRYIYGNVLPLKKDTQAPPDAGIFQKYSLTVPGAVRSMAGGLMDLAEGPMTGTVTPQGTLALGNLMITNPATFGSVASQAANAARAGAASNLLEGQAAKEAATPGILGKQFQEAPTAPGFKAGEAAGPTSPVFGLKDFKLDKTSTPNADPMSPATNKFVQMLTSAAADKLAHGIGMAAGHVVGDIPGAMIGYYVAPILKDVAAAYGPNVAAAVGAALKAQGKGIVSPGRTLPGVIPQPQGNQLQNPSYQNMPVGVGTPYA